jgi:hypothetical protein
VLNSKLREKLFDADRPAEAQLADPYALLAAIQRLRQDVTRESEELSRKWQPAIQRRSFLPSMENLAAYLALQRQDRLESTL